MSLPSTVFYYDRNGIEIHRDHVNIGWTVYEDAWIDCVHEQVFYVQNAVIVDLYGIKFALKWKHPKYEDLLRQLFNERLAVDIQKQNLNGYRDYLKIKQFAEIKQCHKDQIKTLMPMIRKVVPSLIAEEIIGVQPMTEPGNLVFSLRHRYFKESWYIRVWKYFKHVLFRGDDPRIWITLREINRELQPSFLGPTWAKVHNTLIDEFSKWSTK